MKVKESSAVINTLTKTQVQTGLGHFVEYGQKIEVPKLHVG